ncbi:hypothetical protein L1887_06383 [Cichorium endivia]|nr:hypothetical protein L1887_06383 [Cichorium endivia]
MGGEELVHLCSSAYFYSYGGHDEILAIILSSLLELVFSELYLCFLGDVPASRSFECGPVSGTIRQHYW